MRSRSGCDVCRHRKIKCDEKLPVCGYCLKKKQNCERNTDNIFRHKHNVYINGPRRIRRRTQASSGPIGEARGKALTSLPELVSSVEAEVLINGLDARNANFTHSHEQQTGHLSSPEQAEISITNRQLINLDPGHADVNVLSEKPGNSPPTSNILNSNSIMMVEINSGVSMPSNRQYHSPFHRSISNFTALEGRATVDACITHSPDSIPHDYLNARESSFLLRHFSETLGMWMDLFDVRKYFSAEVPIRASNTPLLQYSAMAVAAKNLHLINHYRCSPHSLRRSERYLKYSHQDLLENWDLKSRAHYNEAISLLQDALSSYRRHITTAQTPNNGERNLLHASEHVDPDDMLAATAILCVFEFMDASDIEWSGHLSGAKSLLDNANLMSASEVSGDLTIHSSDRPKLSRARRSIFWNFARQDLIAAFIHGSFTRLDTENHELWRSAGLSIDDEGFYQPVSSESPRTVAYHGPEYEEDMISNAMIRTVSRIVNFISGLKQSQDSTQRTRSLSDTNQQWNDLRRELKIWFEGRPECFQPTARIEPHNNQVDDYKISNGFPMEWYARSMCGSAMQLYHMGQALILIHKPHQYPENHHGISEQFRYFQHIDSEIKRHAREICGIALSMPDDDVRVNMVQPLYVAGSCLTDERQRNVVLSLLRDIENDTGWAAGYRVEQLLQEWNNEINLD